MRAVSTFQNVYLHLGRIDFRKSIDGLARLVELEMEKNPFESSLFVFLCRRRQKIKLLYWDRNGFALWVKRLECHKFPWPKNRQAAVHEVSAREMDWLLEGVDIFLTRPHESLNYSRVG